MWQSHIEHRLSWGIDNLLTQTRKSHSNKDSFSNSTYHIYYWKLIIYITKSLHLKDNRFTTTLQYVTVYCYILITVASFVIRYSMQIYFGKTSLIWRHAITHLYCYVSNNTISCINTQKANVIYMYLLFVWCLLNNLLLD